jgi:hypothetical protein
MRLGIALVIASAVLLAGCTPTAPPVTPPSPSTSQTQEPQTRPALPLGGECADLLSDGELAEVTGVAHATEALGHRDTWSAGTAGGMTCAWQDPSGVRSVWITIFPSATIPADEATTCAATIDCFFTRHVGGYRVDGYVALPTSTSTMIDALIALVAPRLAGAPAAPWSPEGAWSGGVTLAELATLDVAGVLPSPSGPLVPEPGGYQPASVPEADAAVGYQPFYWEGPDGSVIGLEILPGGGWAFAEAGGRIAVDVPGASDAAWIPEEFPADAVAAPGSSPLLVTDGANLLRITGDADPASIVDFAADALALLGAR